MILLIDAGNTRIKWASLEGKRVEYRGVITRSSAATRDFSGAGWDDLEPPEAVYVASVAGEKFARTLANWVKRKWKLDVVFITTSARGYGVVNAYSDAERLGVDRWLALIAAHDAHPGPVCIVDCGTAITLDALSAKGEHEGGLIMPGLSLMQECIKGHASNIDEVALNAEARTGLLATDTGNAIIGGALYAAVAMVERVVADLAAEWHEPVQCLLTGGDAQQLLPLLSVKVTECPNLVFEGMAVIVRQNQNAGRKANHGKEKKRA